jgi:hypothetical protein
MHYNPKQYLTRQQRAQRERGYILAVAAAIASLIAAGLFLG